MKMFFNQHKLQCLTLRNIRLRSEEACRAVAAADLQCLDLERCRLTDRGAALVESVREGRGPGELRFHFPSDDDDDADDGQWVPSVLPFDSPERCISFLKKNKVLIVTF
jgi:hypothetical protein